MRRGIESGRMSLHLLLTRLELTDQQRRSNYEKNTLNSNEDQGKTWFARCVGYGHGQGADRSARRPAEQSGVPQSTGRPGYVQDRHRTEAKFSFIDRGPNSGQVVVKPESQTGAIAFDVRYALGGTG